MAQQQEKATSGWGKVRGNLDNIVAQGREARDNAKANLDAKMEKNKDRTLHDALIEGQTGIKQGAEDAYQEGVKGYETAGQAKEVAEQEAARVHAETVSNTQSSQSDGGEEERTEAFPIVFLFR